MEENCKVKEEEHSKMEERNSVKLQGFQVIFAREKKLNFNFIEDSENSFQQR